LIKKIKEGYGKKIKGRQRFEIPMYQALIKMNYFEQEIWELFLGSLKTIKYRKIEDVSAIYENLI
jgi:hypothetical protein